MSTQHPVTPHLVVGVDVGGTFTDLFVLDERDGSARIVKVPSTRGEEARGFMNGVARVSEGHAPALASGAPPISGVASSLATIVHGTTVGTNALLERKVARTGIITTRGFRDVLEMRRRDRPQTRRANVQHQPDPRQAARDDNLARAFAGSEAAIRRRSAVGG